MVPGMSGSYEEVPPTLADFLLRTPEETVPPAVVARALELQREWWVMPEADAAGVERLLCDGRLLAVHKAMLPPPRRPRLDPIDPTLLAARTKIEEAETLGSALAVLTVPELAAGLGDGVALERLAILAPRASRGSTVA
jgi:membrane glycosyltransferase